MASTHVLVPLDGSPLAEEALVQALETFDCPVTVLNVVTPIDASMSESGVLEPDEERREDARERAEKIVATAKRRAAQADCGEEANRRVETVVETGDPAETIVEYVEDNDVDHVVMGSHSGERNKLAQRLLGTVATKVVTQAPVTVTVVR